MLMQNAKSKQSIELVDDSKNKKKELYNDLVGLTKTECPNQMVHNLKRLLETVTNALWLIDPNQFKV